MKEKVKNEMTLKTVKVTWLITNLSKVFSLPIMMMIKSISLSLSLSLSLSSIRRIFLQQWPRQNRIVVTSFCVQQVIVGCKLLKGARIGCWGVVQLLLGLQIFDWARQVKPMLPSFNWLELSIDLVLFHLYLTLNEIKITC